MALTMVWPLCLLIGLPFLPECEYSPDYIRLNV